MKMIGAYPGDEGSSFFKLFYLTPDARIMKTTFIPATDEFGKWEEVNPPPLNGNGHTPVKRAKRKIGKRKTEGVEKTKNVGRPKDESGIEEVLRLHKAGMPTSMISKKLKMPISTVYFHLKKVRQPISKSSHGPIKTLKDMDPTEQKKIKEQYEVRA